MEAVQRYKVLLYNQEEVTNLRNWSRSWNVNAVSSNRTGHRSTIRRRYLMPGENKYMVRGVGEHGLGWTSRLFYAGFHYPGNFFATFSYQRMHMSTYVLHDVQVRYVLERDVPADWVRTGSGLCPDYSGPGPDARDPDSPYRW